MICDMNSGNFRNGTRNKLLQGMNNKSYAEIELFLKDISLDRFEKIEQANKVITHICFPEPCVISIISQSLNKTMLETNMVGPEGMTGSSLIYGINRTPNDALVQLPGRGSVIKASNFNRIIRNNRPLHCYFLQYAHSKTLRSAYNSMSGLLYSAKKRLARWLFMAHDRIESDDISITHESLSEILGVRRAGITISLRYLINDGGITVSRRAIVVCDRTLLRASASEAYGSSEKICTPVMQG